MQKLESSFKEEQWGRIEPKDIGISRFKILDDLFNSIVADDSVEEVKSVTIEQLEANPASITALYLIGLIGFYDGNIEFSLNIRKLIDLFNQSHKWAVVQMLCEKILEHGENSYALRSLAVSLERQGKSKEAIPVLENLIKIDRFDSDVAKKLSFAIIDEDPEKSIYYMKLSIEGFIKNKEFEEIHAVWSKLVTHSWDDIAFFERIERMLVDSREQDLAAELLKGLLHKYRDEENPDQTIELLKKILRYRIDDTAARRELIKFYKIKYGDHSEYEQFLQLSKLNHFKTPVRFAIEDFEKNIVFDKGNYAFHISWKLGKILDINSENILISFKEKAEHNMSINMALSSLTPIPKDHLYVFEYEDPEGARSLFEEDFNEFFKVLVKSYGGKIQLGDIKHELIPRYIDEKTWGKWWTKARTKIKKDPNFGVSDKKKDTFFFREKPITFVEELLDNFIKNDSFSEKLDIAIEFVNNIDVKEGSSVVQFYVDYFNSEVKGSSDTRKILSYFILKDLTKFIDESKLKLEAIHEKVLGFIKESDELPIISMKIGSYDYKKDFVNIIEESREDWPQVVLELLFETPVRIHKYIVNNLMRASEFNVVNSFIDRVLGGGRQSPDIFLWVSRNLLSKTWDYQWLDYSLEDLTLSYFRFINDLKKIENDGNRLKNMAVDFLFDNENAMIKEIVSVSSENVLGKIYDLFSNTSFITEDQSEKLLLMIKEKFEDFSVSSYDGEADAGTEEFIYTSPEGFEKKKAELNQMINVDVPRITKELASVSEATSDVRENVEYNSFMEKQAILESTIAKLEKEMKLVKVIESDSIVTDSVNIGTKVTLKSGDGKELLYTILGPWDADFEKGILSYRSPIVKEMLGKAVESKVAIKEEEGSKEYTVTSIVKYTE